MANILGINAYHADASACILKNNTLEFAVEEERLNRIKHWAGFPALSIQACLEATNLELTDIDFIAFNSNPYANLHKKIFWVLKNQPTINFIQSRLKNTQTRLNALSDFESKFPGHEVKSKFVKIEHHRAHLASAYYASGFDEACVLSVDGFGDFSSAAWGLAQNNTIDICDFVHYPHSLGIFYQALTQYLGFKHYGDEYKVMGMAAYGNPVYVEALQQLCVYQRDGQYRLELEYFLHHSAQSSYGFESGTPHCSDFYSDHLISLLGPSRHQDEPIEQKHKDIACSAQVVYERAFFSLCNRLYDKYKVDNLALSGGCAMNSLANGKIASESPFKNIYIQAAAGDAGGAIGAAYCVAMQQNAPREKLRMPHAYWGPRYSNSQYKQFISEYEAALHDENCLLSEVCDTDELCNQVAQAISAGQVIGWFQGALEWGPRALGNRSILADPRRSDIQEILNLKIKRRESFRPFAPSVLKEEVGQWFERDEDVPFMTQVFMIKEGKRTLIPAVTHVDGSGRLQTVSQSSNPMYHSLIEKFFHLTGIPMLLNTSFNENEPIVCHPRQAIDCFLRTKMDCLVLGHYLIKRPAQSYNNEG